MLTLLWWIADLVMIVVVLPVVAVLALRIIRGLLRAHRALVSIAASAQAVADTLPPALAEVSAAVEGVESLVPAKTPVTTG
jgi:hypothetical protein